MNNFISGDASTENQYVSNTDLSNVDLSNVDLNNIDLSNVDLSKIDTSKIDLSKIDKSKLKEALDGSATNTITAGTTASDNSSITSQLIKSFQEQNEVGFVVIMITLALFVAGTLMLRKVWMYYKGLSTKFKDNTRNVSSEELASVEFKDSELRNIVKAFKKSVRAGVDNINTEVIISKNTKGKIQYFESFVKLVPAASTGLGLLGTFLGLTLAIAQTKNSLSGISSIITFTIKLQQPIASMASAFWTSIVGVIISLTMNALIINMKNAKNEYYDLLEDYLDNSIITASGRNKGSVSEEILASFEKSFNDMAVKITEAIKDGVSNNRGNGSEYSRNKMTEDTFLSYTDELNAIILNINNNLNNISVPIEDFKNTINNFALVSDELNTRFDNSITRLVDNISGLDENLGGIQNTIDNNNSYIKNIEEAMKVQSRNLTNSYQSLTEGVDVLKSAAMKQLESIRKMDDTLKNGFRERNDESLSNTGYIDDNGNSKELSSAIKELDMTLNAIKSATNELAKNSLIVGQMIKGTNQWLMANNMDEAAADHLERK